MNANDSMQRKWIVAALCVVGFLMFIVTFHTSLARGFLYLGNGFFGGVLPYNLSLAEVSYTVALALDENVPDVWHQRARISFLDGNFPQARERINTQLTLHGDGLMASYYIRGLINGYDKRYKEAEEDFSRFLVWDPSNWAANNDLAWIYFAQGKFAEAEARSREGLLYNDTNPWLLTMHGMSLFNLGQKEEAQRELTKAKTEALTLTSTDWQKAYPGNDPTIAPEGLAALVKTIETNLELVHK